MSAVTEGWLLSPQNKYDDHKPNIYIKTVIELKKDAHSLPIKNVNKNPSLLEP